MTQYVREVAEVGGVLQLSVDGRPCPPVADECSRQMFLELVDRLETIEALQEAIADLEAGSGQPVAEAFEELRRKHGLPQFGE